VKGSDTNKQWFGAEEDWAKAEKALADALDARGIEYERVEGEAAFYGQKIDFKVEDAIGRLWQLGNGAVGFQSAGAVLSWSLSAKTTNRIARSWSTARCLVRSSAFLGVLIEHYAGAFPFWLAPVQVAVLPDHGPR